MSKNKCNQSRLQLTSERSQIIGLLRYVVDDVDLISPHSALFLKLAIQNLENEEEEHLQKACQSRKE